MDNKIELRTKEGKEKIKEAISARKIVYLTGWAFHRFTNIPGYRNNVIEPANLNRYGGQEGSSYLALVDWKFLGKTRVECAFGKTQDEARIEMIRNVASVISAAEGLNIPFDTDLS